MPQRRDALVSTEARPAGPVDHSKLVLASGATNLWSNHNQLIACPDTTPDSDSDNLVRVAGLAPATFPS